MGLDYRVRCCPDGLMTDRRRAVQVLDCTIRDGGCTNAWQFSDAHVRATFEALRDAGVDVMELGYQTAPGVYERTEVGPWRFCDEADLRRVAEASDMQLACMLDMGRIRPEDLRPADDSLVDVLRIATYAADVPQAIDLAHHAIELGYRVYVNVMAVTTCTPQEVDGFLEALRRSAVHGVYVVDSFGALYPHQTRYLLRKYKNWLRADQLVGVHFHNNQQTAFANTIAAIDEGADLVDATVYGMGRGAGNCPLELLLMYLDDPRHDVRPVLDLIERTAPLQSELRWGYSVPYGITGWLNVHPRTAIRRMASDDRHRALDFFRELSEHRPHPPHHRARREP